MSSYTDPAIQTLINKLNADGPAALQGKYVWGDPLQVPQSMLPLCFISIDTTQVDRYTSQTDRHIMPIVLNVVARFTDKLDPASLVDAGTSMVTELVQARNADLSLKPATILGVLLKYEVLDGPNKLHIGVDSGNSVSVEYGISPAARRGFMSAEALVRTSLVLYTDNPSI